jgi:endoglucanase
MVVALQSGTSQNQRLRTLAAPPSADATGDSRSPIDAAGAGTGSSRPGPVPGSDVPGPRPAPPLNVRPLAGPRPRAGAGAPSAAATGTAEGGGLQGPLSTQGNRILDAGGHPIVLRGVNRIGLQTPGGSPAITDAEIAHANAWGANIVRVLVGEASTDTQCPGQFMPNYFDDVDAVVHSLTSRGMVALLDLHTVTRVPCGASDAWRMADAPGSINFWTKVASRYKGNSLVAFDLYNEPNNITADQWRNGGVLVDKQFLQPPVQWTAAGMQQMYDAVRSTGATNLVMVSGNGWGGDPSAILAGYAISGTNVVYAAHSYTCSHNNEPACTANPANKKVAIASLWATVAEQYPVMITEFGWPDPNDGSYNASVIRYAQSQNPPWGWIAFAWDGTQNNGFVLVRDLATYEPDPAGAPVKAALQAPP